MRGNAGTLISFNEIRSLDENPRTRGRGWRGTPHELGRAGAMLIDPHVRQNRDNVSALLTQGDWDFEPGDGSPAAEQAAAAAREAWIARVPWRVQLGRIVDGYYTYGFHIEEAVFKLRADRWVCDLKERPAWSIAGWEADGDQCKAVLQDSATPGAQVRIPRRSIVRFTWKQSGANFEGEAPLRQAFGPWWAKRVLEKVELLQHNKHHTTIPVVTRGDDLSASDEADEAIQEALARWQGGERAYLMVPHGYQVELKEAQAGTDIGPTIERKQYSIAYGSSLGWALHGSGSSNTHGSYALASVQENLFAVLINHHADFVCDVFNKGLDGWSPVRRLHALNFGEDVPAPRLVVRNLPTVDWSAVLPVILNAVSAGVITPDAELEGFVRRVMRVPDLRGRVAAAGGSAGDVAKDRAKDNSDDAPEGAEDDE